MNILKADKCPKPYFVIILFLGKSTDTKIKQWSLKKIEKLSLSEIVLSDRWVFDMFFFYVFLISPIFPDSYQNLHLNDKDKGFDSVIFRYECQCMPKDTVFTVLGMKY